MAARPPSRDALLWGAEPGLPLRQGVWARCHDANGRLPSGTIAAPGICVREGGDGRSVPVVGEVRLAWRGGAVGCAVVLGVAAPASRAALLLGDRKSTRLNSSHLVISYAV